MAARLGPRRRRLKGLLLTQHPHTEIINVTCSNCGAEHRVRSTANAYSVDVCSNCHPVYTGAMRVAASGDRVERFNRRRALAVA
jgi:large subunit ribosomal protein L31